MDRHLSGSSSLLQVHTRLSASNKSAENIPGGEHVSAATGRTSCRHSVVRIQCRKQVRFVASVRICPMHNEPVQCPAVESPRHTPWYWAQGRRICAAASIRSRDCANCGASELSAFVRKHHIQGGYPVETRRDNTGTCNACGRKLGLCGSAGHVGVLRENATALHCVRSLGFRRRVRVPAWNPNPSAVQTGVICGKPYPSLWCFKAAHCERHCSQGGGGGTFPLSMWERCCPSDASENSVCSTAYLLCVLNLALGWRKWYKVPRRTCTMQVRNPGGGARVPRSPGLHLYKNKMEGVHFC